MPAKPQYATLHDVQTLTEDLTTKINAVSAEIASAVSNSERRLQQAIEAVTEQVGKNADAATATAERIGKDAQNFTEQSVQNLRKELMTQIRTTTEKAIATSEAKLRQEIAEVSTVANALLREAVTKLAHDFDDQLQTLNAIVQEGFKEVSTSSREADAKVMGDFEPKIKEAKKAAKEQGRMLKEAADDEYGKLRQETGEAIAEVYNKAREQQNEVYMQLENLKALINDAVKAADVASHEVSDLQTEALTQLRHDAEEHLAHLDADGAKLRNAISEVENMSTRRVDWVIQKASRQIRPTSASKAQLHRSWFSPKFNCAGAFGLQLELQYYRVAEPAAPDQELGDCAIFLWASKGMSLAFRLYVGTKYETFEKTFNGTVPYGTKRFCFLRDVISRNDDTLKLSIEVLESHREIARVIEQPPDPEEEPLPGVEIQKPLDGLVQFHRHVNNRLYDQVKNECELMKSRMVRRVEWRVEQASKLRQCFPMGESICSTPFMAAGLENLQLIFYPSGYTGSTDGFCSLFLYGPAGCTLKCKLILGPQVREASHSFEEAGAFGRTNFCRLEGVIDESDDTVMVALEVEEAHQDLVAKIAHPIVTPGDRRSLAQIEGSTTEAIKSVIKVQSSPGKSMPGLDHTRVLPSLWTTNMSDSMTSPPAGSHTFDELKARSKGGGRRLGTPSAPSALASPVPPSSADSRGGRMPRTQSTPTLVAGGPPASPPLPPLSAGSSRRRREAPTPPGVAAC